MSSDMIANSTRNIFKEYSREHLTPSFRLIYAISVSILKSSILIDNYILYVTIHFVYRQRLSR